MAAGRSIWKKDRQKKRAAPHGEGELVTVSATSEGGESATETATDKVVGITAEAVKKGDPVVYYLTGEFFADAITLPNGVEIGTLKDSLRRLSQTVDKVPYYLYL